MQARFVEIEIGGIDHLDLLTGKTLCQVFLKDRVIAHNDNIAAR